MLLSIVAPVYNVEDYLKDFIFSLEKQKTINNYYELILIGFKLNLFITYS